MASTDISPIIILAKDLLYQNPYDEGHDLSHHERVWKIAQDIVNHENLKININALQVAVFWHDVLVQSIENRDFNDRSNNTENTISFLTEKLMDNTYDSNFITIVIEAIKHHSFNDKQTNLEGKVLFDADKLDALSTKRVIRILRAVKNKRMSKLKLFLYEKTGKIWIATMKNKLHFLYSKNYFERRLQEIRSELKNGELGVLASELGIDVETFQKLLARISS